MKSILITILLFFVCMTSTVAAKHGQFEFSKITFNGVPYFTSKKEVFNEFGPVEPKETRYFCGFYSYDQAGAPYYQLVYQNFVYIGSEKESYQLESIDFDSQGKIKINYEESVISGKSTVADFVKIFGPIVTEYLAKNPTKDSIPLGQSNSDDAILFIFKNGRLVRYEYWSPC